MVATTVLIMTVFVAGVLLVGVVLASRRRMSTAAARQTAGAGDGWSPAVFADGGGADCSDGGAGGGCDGGGGGD